MVELRQTGRLKLLWQIDMKFDIVYVVSHELQEEERLCVNNRKFDLQTRLMINKLRNARFAVCKSKHRFTHTLKCRAFPHKFGRKICTTNAGHFGIPRDLEHELVAMI